jgi:hypothetical protein
MKIRIVAEFKEEFIMKTTKNIFSAILALSMVCGTASIVSADTVEITDPEAGASSKTQTGAGSSEGFVETKLLRVVLPTQSMDYIVDAQGLIKKSYATGKTQNHKGETIVYSTKAADKAVTDAKKTHEQDANVLDDGFVFFTTTDKGKNTLSNYVDLVIENKGTYDVDITPSLEFVKGSADGLDAETWTNAPGEKELAFNLTKKTYDKAAKKYVYTDVKAADAENPTAFIVGNASAYYTTEYDSTGNKYNYALNESNYSKAKDLDNTVTFTLEAFSSKDNVDADNITATGSIKIVWAIAEHVATQSSEPADPGNGG